MHARSESRRLVRCLRGRGEDQQLKIPTDGQTPRTVENIETHKIIMGNAPAPAPRADDGPGPGADRPELALPPPPVIAPVAIAPVTIGGEVLPYSADSLP